MFLDLSVELLQEIGSQVCEALSYWTCFTNHSHRSRSPTIEVYLGFAIDPLFFSSLVLRTNQLRLEDGESFLQTLATGKAGWTSYAKALTITPGRTRDVDKVAEIGVQMSDQGLFALALGSLKSIRKVRWQVDASTPEWQHKSICDLLDTLPLLDDLHIDMGNMYSVRVDLPLGDLSHLCRLEIRTPYCSTTPMVRNVSQAVAQSRSLTSLRLHGYHDWSEVWNMFAGTTNYQLKDLSTQIVTPALITYLASYSGIEKLTLESPDGLKQTDPTLVDNFFDRVLHMHAKSLVELSCAGGYEGRWSFGTHNVAAISELHQLTRLEMNVNAVAVIGIEPWTNAVHLLLRTAAQLPALRSLAIRGANSPGNRGARCGNPRMRHVSKVHKAITEAVLNFRSHVASRAIVQVGHTFYELKSAILEEGAEEGHPLGYCEIPRVIQIVED
ncbi:hypothetical protein FB451DRAFT_1396986 [Mycena latifolia]|nr:hypothetical protein FB451DRAFT_1396986 [Mycena latifolia]